MRKTDKKRDNQLRQVLTEVCDAALEDIEGFQWLTHRVDYARFPESLKVICVFDTDGSLTTFLSGSQSDRLALFMQKKLAGAGVDIKHMSAHISYDSEEQCEREHQGQWARRLK
ncbi:hypothetical protein imdm_13 [gamma proteobacterium IMCC2047]|nr:hypothetical protein imdm_13 [gamma proteobacterium IMCC2047]